MTTQFIAVLRENDSTSIGGSKKNCTPIGGTRYSIFNHRLVVHDGITIVYCKVSMRMIC